LLIVAPTASSCARSAYVRPTPTSEASTRQNADVVTPGTLAGAQVRQQLSSSTSRPGDRFTAELLDPLVDGSGHAVVEKGAVLQGVVQGTDTSRFAGDAAGLQLQLLGVEQPGEGIVRLPMEIAASPVEIESGVKREVLAGVAGLAAGAGVGIAIDKDRSGVVLGSALVGAGVGALAMYIFGSRQATLPGGSVVTLRVTQPVQLERPVAANGQCYPAAPARTVSKSLEKDSVKVEAAKTTPTP
jgi:hypothetical protein